ncbi:MAG: hypothetical protein IPI24_14065 [Ignavibacteria bacterium]|nr:hypothetical protein [Ignavibacteria bacterium]
MSGTARELTHTAPKTMVGNQAQYDFTWTAPTTQVRIIYAQLDSQRTMTALKTMAMYGTDFLSSLRCSGNGP